MSVKSIFSKLKINQLREWGYQLQLEKGSCCVRGEVHEKWSSGSGLTPYVHTRVNIYGETNCPTESDKA